jgi:hypothetical protein
MTRFTFPRRLLAAAVIGVLATALAGVAKAGPAEPAVPVDIAVREGHKLFLIGHAVGVQIHTCTTSGWTFVGPRADVYDDDGKLLMTHFGGPSWQARDGSLVKATLDGRVTVDPTAIPWLRLAVTSATAGPDGDRLEGTKYIQRIATTGGLAPAAADCTASTVGTTEEVPYTADYTFWKAIGN